VCSITVGIFKNIPAIFLTSVVTIRIEIGTIIFSRKLPQPEVTGLLFPAGAWAVFLATRSDWM
jgi:hypothetical protein